MLVSRDEGCGHRLCCEDVQFRLDREGEGRRPGVSIRLKRTTRPASICLTSVSPHSMTALDFDGDYGRTYASTIRRSIPAYDALLEIGAAALASLAPQASTALIVGPGVGEELPGLFAALPQAHFTLLEPSEQMRRSCAGVIEREGAGERCNLLDDTLQQARQFQGEPFTVVVCHHVLHLMRPEEQRLALRQLTSLLAPGGLLLVSSYSEPADTDALERVMAIAATRLRGLGLDETTLAKFMAGRNTVVFSLNESLLAEELAAAGLEPPQRLLQALGSLLWLSRRP